ncbi:hypothetical protein [Chryseobacterium sp. 18068]|uniref:hypothetical protein n=1 Tax=Chryseobacterium sp. 18068 TaxID=2681414 RepID=UPI00135A7FB1|nr:hypothetical protein [Chryseobacterium sp. 18068]
MNISITIQLENQKIRNVEIEELFQLLFGEQISGIMRNFEIKEVGEVDESHFIIKARLLYVPRVGEFFSIDKILYHIVGIEHKINIHETGIIYVKKTNKVLQAVQMMRY